MLTALVGWLAHTGASDVIRKISWIIPTVQTIHILSISIVIASACLLDLRLLQLLRHPVSIAGMARRFIPWIWGALCVLLLTGSILIVGEPGRELLNAMFWIKMSLIVVAVGVTASLQFTLRRNHGFWELSRGRRGLARATAVLSLVLWLSVIVAGRWIAYTTADT